MTVFILLMSCPVKNTKSVSHLNYWPCLPSLPALLKIKVLQYTKSISSIKTMILCSNQVQIDTRMSKGAVLGNSWSLLSDCHYTLIFIVITTIKALFASHTHVCFIMLSLLVCFLYTDNLVFRLSFSFILFCCLSKF